MTSLVDSVMHGGGLEGASEKQVRAVLRKLEGLAVVVPHRALPTAYFQVATGEPCILFYRNDGGGNSTAPFTVAHLSVKRSLTAMREAMAAHAVITAAAGPQRARWEAARDLYLRQQLEADAVAQGGARPLAEGTL